LNRWLDLADHRLEYVWHGPPPREAPALVFLHDGLGSVSSWSDFPLLLAESSGCGALVYSRRGHGGSDRAILPRAVRFLHDEALAMLPRILETLGVAEPILVGEGDGASIALIAAAEGRIRARGLLLEAPRVFVEPVCLRTIESASRAFERGDLRRALARHHESDVDATFRGWAGVWLDPEFQAWNIEEALPRVSVPVLAIQGEGDPYGTLRQVETIAAKCAGFAKVLVLRNCGHSPHREKPDRTREEMARFLRDEILSGNPGARA
jgi:pimeloyl-ACP methyl ester carboxylesterase